MKAATAFITLAANMVDTDSLEIIDLTESPPPPEPIVIQSDEDDVEASSPKDTKSGKEMRKSRRKKRKKGGPIEDGEVAESSTQASRIHSRERQADRNRIPPSRRRSHSPEPRRRSPSPRLRGNFTDLFYVDVLPAQVSVSVKPTIPGEKRPDSDCATNNEMDHSKLLLPEHVSVFGVGENGAGPVEIIGPPTPKSGDEDEDFIEYLDYDDRNKVIFVLNL